MNRIRKLLTAMILCVVGIFFIRNLGIDIISVEGVIPVGIILITGVMLYIKLTNGDKNKPRIGRISSVKN